MSTIISTAVFNTSKLKQSYRIKFQGRRAQNPGKIEATRSRDTVVLQYIVQVFSESIDSQLDSCHSLFG